MPTFFHQLYKYKQSDLKHQKENYFIEILAHCLVNDKIFQTNFLSLIDCREKVMDFDCKTQSMTPDLGKPDLSITINKDTCILIECKVNSTQSETQLKRYCEILSKSRAKKKYLIFLTKYFEEIESIQKSIKFKHIRWYHVFDCLNESSNEISKEFHKYLKEERMSTNISFTKSELSAIKTIQETLGKMGEFLVRTKDTLSSQTNAKIKLLKQIEYGHYGIITDFHNGKLWIGFYQYDNNEEIQLSISIEDVPFTNSNFKTLDKELKLLNWDYYDNETEDKRTWYNSKDLSTFIESDKFDTNRAQMFLELEIQKISRWFKRKTKVV